VRVFRALQAHPPLRLDPMVWFGLFRDQREVLVATERALLDSQPWANAAEARAAVGIEAAETETPNPAAALDDATTTAAAAAAAPPSQERNVRFVRDVAPTYEVSDVPVTVGGEAHSIHTIKATSAVINADVGCGGGDPIVLWHGYAQGGASWWRNLSALAMQHRSGTVLAPDWLGCGGSSRPNWTAGNDGEAAEDWFVDSFEQWRQQQGLERMHIVAHSMGAIIAVRYAERFPQHVSSLVLASPAGMPHPPSETFRDQLNAEPLSAEREIFRTLGNAWDAGYSPQYASRLFGGWLGRRMVQEYVSRRFEESVTNKPEFAEYMYQHWQGKASGELALQAMLSPGPYGGYAKRPLIDRIPALEPNIPITFIYGDRDWMDNRPAQQIKRRLAQQAGRVVRCFELEGAGHQLMIDQPESFNDIVLKVIHDDEVARGMFPHTIEYSSADSLKAIMRMEAAGMRRSMYQPGLV